MPRITHFEIPSDDVQRAQKFYSSVFNWEFAKWDGPTDYWMIKTGKDEEHGIDGGLTNRAPGHTGITTTITVSSVAEFSEKIIAQGGEIIVPKVPIPKIGWYAQCADTEGNMFGIIEIDKEAP